MNQYYVIINTIDPDGQTWMTSDKMTAYQQSNQLLVNQPNLWLNINDSKLDLYLDTIDQHSTVQDHQKLFHIDRSTLETIQEQYINDYVSFKTHIKKGW